MDGWMNGQSLHGTHCPKILNYCFKCKKKERKKPKISQTLSFLRLMSMFCITSSEDPLTLTAAIWLEY